MAFLPLAECVVEGVSSVRSACGRSAPSARPALQPPPRAASLRDERTAEAPAGGAVRPGLLRGAGPGEQPEGALGCQGPAPDTAPTLAPGLHPTSHGTDALPAGPLHPSRPASVPAHSSPPELRVTPVPAGKRCGPSTAWHPQGRALAPGDHAVPSRVHCRQGRCVCDLGPGIKRDSGLLCGRVRRAAWPTCQHPGRGTGCLRPQGARWRQGTGPRPFLPVQAAASPPSPNVYRHREATQNRHSCPQRHPAVHLCRSFSGA